MRCKNSELLKKISSPKLTKQDEVSFTILRDLQNCRRIKTRDVAEGSTAGTYNKWLIPRNHFECLGKGCVNSGTYLVTEATPDLKYFARFDATEFAAGAIVFYVYDTNKTAKTLTVKIGDTAAMANADSYSVTVAAADYDEAGFAPVVVDLSKAGTDVGDGWTPSKSGAYIEITGSAALGISSISIFDSVEDFATVDTVKVGCLSSVGGGIDLSLIEGACTKAKYNGQMGGLSYNVTGKQVTANYWKLNPMMGKGKATKGFEIRTVEETPVANGNYAEVTLPDLYQAECRFVAIQRKGACNETDAGLTQLYVPADVSMTPEHYRVIKNADGSTTLRFHAELAGFPLLISYPMEVEVDERTVNAENLNGTHVSMAVPVCEADRVKEMHVFNNVFITSFPNSLSENDTDFSFTINIQPDEGGDYFHIYRIVE